MERRVSFLLTGLIVLGLGFSLFPAALRVTAQTRPELRIDGVDSAAFPKIILPVSVLDERGYPVAGLAAENFTVSEDGQPGLDVQLTPVSQHPVQIAILVDLSHSTTYGPKPTPLQSIQAAAQTFIEALPADDQVAILTFTRDVVVQQDLTADRPAAAAALAGWQTGARADQNDALVQALELLHGRALRPVIILITDSPDSGAGRYSLDQTLQQLRQQPAVVFPVGWGGAPQGQMEQLAQLTHGTAQVLPGPYPSLAAFEGAFSQITGLLPGVRGQYQLTVQSALPADGKEHQLTVQVDYLGQRLEASRTFEAIQSEIFLTFPTLADGQTTGGRLKLAPRVDAPAPLKQIDVLIDDQPLTSLIAEPFLLDWDSTQVTPGEHELTFLAQDMAGNSGEAALRLTIRPPIEVVLTAPQKGETVTGQVGITAEVSGLSQITRVEFRVDDHLIQTLNQPPYTVEWASRGASAGGHVIEVTAYDANGYSQAEELRVNVPASPGGGWGVAVILFAIAAGSVLYFTFGHLRARPARPAASGSGETILPSSGAEPAVEPAAEPSPPAAAVLRELQGLNPGQVWGIPPANALSLGRKRDENDVPLLGQTASRKHALISFHNDQYLLENLRPENPVYVNDLPVDGLTPLYPGDTIRAGESVFVFEIEI